MKKNSLCLIKQKIISDHFTLLCILIAYKKSGSWGELGKSYYEEENYTERDSKVGISAAPKPRG
jgi:hypothetical protein